MSDIQEEQKRLYKRAEENDIKLLQEENKKLKELCNKYEEEHNTTFIEWQKDINIIDELHSDLKTLWIVLWNMDTEMTGYQNEIFDKYYDEFHKE